MEGHELVTLLKHHASFANEDDKPWFFGCQYKCALCGEDKKPFYTTSALKKHISKFHIDPWVYLLQSGLLETKVEYFHCDICSCDNIKRNFHDIRNHLKKKHNGLSMTKYGDRYHYNKLKQGDSDGDHDDGDLIDLDNLLVYPENSLKLEENYSEQKVNNLKQEENNFKQEETSSDTDFIPKEDEIGNDTHDNKSEKPSVEHLRDSKATKVKPSFKCGICDEVFEDKQKRFDHRKICSLRKKKDKNQTPKAKSICPECGETFCDAKTVYGHILIAHTNVGSYPCDLCEAVLKTEMSRKNHFKNVHKEPHTCEYCGKHCSNKAMYLKHKVNMHTSDQDKPFKCSYCPKGFATPRDLTRHTRTHTGEKPFKCKLCDKEYGDASTLRQHNLSFHKGIKRSMMKQKVQL